MKNYLILSIILLFTLNCVSTSKIKVANKENTRGAERIDTLYSMEGNQQIVTFKNGIITSIKTFNKTESGESGINNGQIEFYSNGFIKSLYLTVKSEWKQRGDFLEHVEHSNSIYFDSLGYVQKVALQERE
jgi:hypothetical protein